VRPTPALLRRIDRLARRAHAFHRFAHHPLCDAYAGELISLRGRTRVCRGCACAVAGALGGAVLASVCALPLALCTVAASAALLAVFAAQPRSVSAGARPSKWWTRALPTSLLFAAVVTLSRAPSVAHVAWTAGLLALSWAVLGRYRRRGPDRTPCSVCPERGAIGACSGFRTIVRAERAFVRRSERLLDAAISGQQLSP
jgi:hypothetical protein